MRLLRVTVIATALLFAATLACDVLEGGGGGGGTKVVNKEADTGCGVVWAECEYDHHAGVPDDSCADLTGVAALGCADGSIAGSHTQTAACGRADECDDWKAAYHDCLADAYAARAACAETADDVDAYETCADGATPAPESCTASEPDTLT